MDGEEPDPPGAGVDEPTEGLRSGQDQAGLRSCASRCLDHPGHVYILCYGRPTLVSDRDHLPEDPTRDYPITHYVGWTGQQPPLRRIWSHGARSAHHIAGIRPGTTDDEEAVKRHQRCPECGRSLWYYAESPTYRADSPPA